jgi:predicted RNA-binding Zn-ribbon protein involved in translation (DUF1610 family)
MDASQHFCPGSIGLRQPKPEDVQCHTCGREVELWSDEIKARCPGCGALLTRDVPPSCIDWCKWAEQCVGTETYERMRDREGQG